jgi:glycosyltransferase involved in cell wall biosynthesis
MAISETSLRTSAMPGVVNERPMVSIVIPAFNEAERIGESIRKVTEYVRQSRLSIEVIVVDDGSTDATRDIVRANAQDSLRLIENGKNQGKGHSVRQGVVNATGTWVLFTDADLSAPIEELPKLFDVAIKEDADIVVGSRAVDRSYIEKHQNRVRELGGIFFNVMVRLFLGLKLSDTQCGFKLFKRDRTQAVFEKQTTRGFGFDPEILFIAAKRGLKIREVPVRWSHSEGSKVSFLRDGTRMFADLVRIRWNYILGKYS